MDWSELEAKFGPLPAPAAGTKIGGVSKTLTNEYWRSLAKATRTLPTSLASSWSIRPHSPKATNLASLAIAENLISQGFNALLFSPQRRQPDPGDGGGHRRRHPGAERERCRDPVGLANYVGNVQKGNGVNVANWFIANRPDGGKVAVIEGQPGVYAAGQRTAGFTETITAAGKFEVVASVPANWSREEAFNAAATILAAIP
jgi:ribose transport system substrate-binding protein